MRECKAIETVYNGYRFRSRLEARWAVFFDNVGKYGEYVYEPEGFTLSNGMRYLPDFYLPRINTYVEVKPRGAFSVEHGNDGVTITSGREEIEKYAYAIRDALSQQGTSYMIVMGDPYEAFQFNYSHNFAGAFMFSRYRCVPKELLADDPSITISCNGKKCSSCKKNNTIDYCSELFAFGEKGFYCDAPLGTIHSCDGKKTDKTQVFIPIYMAVNNSKMRGDFENSIFKLGSAAIKARQARFEFGECG